MNNSYTPRTTNSKNLFCTCILKRNFASYERSLGKKDKFLSEINTEYDGGIWQLFSI